MAACDGDADAIFQLFLQIVALALNRCPLGDLQANIELGAHAGALLQVPGIKTANGLDRCCGHLVTNGGRSVVGAHVALGLEGGLKTNSIDLLQVAQQVLAHTVGHSELFILVKHDGAAGMKGEIDRVAAKVSRQLFVFTLALLPPRRDQSDATFDPQRRHDPAEGGVEALRAEQHCGARRIVDHGGRRLHFDDGKVRALWGWHVHGALAFVPGRLGPMAKKQQTHSTAADSTHAADSADSAISGRAP